MGVGGGRVICWELHSVWGQLTLDLNVDVCLDCLRR